MPNRWIKEAYCSSSRINAVGPEARDLWVRLLVNADDHGFFHGDAQLVASRCFPLQPNARKCETLLAELERVSLVVRYESGGKRFLAITQWYERPRANPKYPPPPEGVSTQVQTTANSCEQLHVSTTTTTTTPSAPSDVSPGAAAWEGIGKDDLLAWRAAFPACDVPAELARALEWSRANPKNRKSNWRRFLVNWLGRAQERAPARGGAAAARRLAV